MKAIAGAIIVHAGALLWCHGAAFIGSGAGMGWLATPLDAGLFTAGMGVSLILVGLIIVVAGLFERPKMRDMWPGLPAERRPPEPD
jgi:hypothetical protein